MTKILATESMHGYAAILDYIHIRIILVYILPDLTGTECNYCNDFATSIEPDQPVKSQNAILDGQLQIIIVISQD